MTNILYFDTPGRNADDVVKALEAAGIRSDCLGPAHHPVRHAPRREPGGREAGRGDRGAAQAAGVGGRDTPETDTVTIEGTLERVRFTHEDDAWSVVAVRVAEGFPGAGGEVTAVGNLAGVQPGEHLRLTGRWRDHPRWGRQLEVESCLPVAPSTIAGHGALPRLRAS